MSFTKEYQQLNKAQQQAVDTIDGPVMVIAGPGTGKTQLLSMRVANTLKQTDVNPSNILCLTFTESGQQAIQRRLLDLIGEAARQVTIHTFHGFGAAIITANPTYFYDAGQTRAADDLTLFEILYGIFERLPHSSPLSSQNGDEFVFLKDAQARISQLKTAGITPDHLRRILRQDQAWCQLATPLIQQTYGQFSRIHLKYLPLFHELSERLQSVQTAASQLPWLQPLAQSCLTELQQAIEIAENTTATATLSQWKARWLETVNGELQLKAQTQHQRLEALDGIYDQYINGLRRRHLFDYDDMILEVLEALQQQPDLRASLQEQFHYLLIDEYQDTNGAQAQILELLADNPVHEDRPNLMVVGDDDQAIYGFQGADASVMLRFRERWRDVRTIVLTDNYRSSQPILDTTHQIIRQGESRLENYYTDIVKQLIARNNQTPDKPRLVSFEMEVAQYQWLADEIHAQIKRGVKPEEIAVIAPRHKYLQRCLPYLADANIGVAYERHTNVLSDPEMGRFLQLVKAVDAIAGGRQGEVQSLLPEILTYDWWDISPHALWELSLGGSDKTPAPWLERMVAGRHDGLRQVADWLTRVASQSLEWTLDEALDELQTALKGKLDSRRLQTGLSSIVQGLGQYRPNQLLRLHDFAHYVTLAAQAGIAISIKETTTTAVHAIQVMTAHKAKGLEFDQVYLLDATTHIWRTEKGQINKIGLPVNLFGIQPAGETTDDRLRLFYVACTRARNQLTFLTFTQDQSGRQQELLDWLTPPTVQATMTRLQPKLPRPRQLPAAKPYDWRETHHSLLGDPALRAHLEPYLARYRLSPTHLLTFLDVTRGGPRQFLVRHQLQFPEAVSTNMIFGNALHQVLERAQTTFSHSGQLPELPEMVQFLEAALSTYNLRRLDAKNLRERGERALRLYLEQRADGFARENLAEQNFHNENVVLDEVRLTGKIDRLGLDLQQHTAVVTDFKTGRPFHKWQVSLDYDKHKLHRYRQQLLFYKLLVEGSKSFHHYRVNEGVLEFVEPDKWGRVGRLSYEYDQAEQARLEQLIRVVWTKIMQLDLPDTSHYPPDFKGVLAFEEDLLSGKL